MGMRGSSVKKDMPASAVSRGGINGKYIMGVGVLLLVFWVVCVVTQITTNEAWISGEHTINVFRPDWFVLLQPFSFALGQSTNPMAVLFGWGIEILYLAFSVAGFALVRGSIHQSGKVLGFIFELLSYAALGINWWADYSYGTLGLGDWGHFFFACMTAFIVGAFGNIGMFLVKYGYDRA